MQEQKREIAKQRKVIDDLTSGNKEEGKDAAMALNRETLKNAAVSKKPKKKSAAASKQPKKKSKPTDESEESEVDDTEKTKEVEVAAATKNPKKRSAAASKQPKKKSKQTDEGEVDVTETTGEVEVDDLETCVIISHKTDKKGDVKVQVQWKDSHKKDWQHLYDMWADYPTEVIKYQNNNKNQCRGKIWKTPKIEGVTYFMRILGMVGGADKVTEAQFIVLANNGYKFDGEEYPRVKYDELERDDPELLQAFFGSIEDSSETDDASVSSVNVA